LSPLINTDIDPDVVPVGAFNPFTFLLPRFSNIQRGFNPVDIQKAPMKTGKE
jgi:hypothetical protein